MARRAIFAGGFVGETEAFVGGLGCLDVSAGEVELGGAGGGVGGDLDNGAVEATLDVCRVAGGWLGEVFARLVLSSR